MIETILLAMTITIIESPPATQAGDYVPGSLRVTPDKVISPPSMPDGMRPQSPFGPGFVRLIRA